MMEIALKQRNRGGPLASRILQGNDLPAERSIGAWRTGGVEQTGLFEWSLDTVESITGIETSIKDRVATKPIRPEEAMTLPIGGTFRGPPHAALIYHCNSLPINLRQVLQSLSKPSNASRHFLAGIIVNQVRSLHVHYQLAHRALRTESFVFFRHMTGNANANANANPTPSSLDLKTPYVLDWGRRPALDVYQHPEQASKDVAKWYNQAWALLMILTEIAEWHPLDHVAPDCVEAYRTTRRRQVTTTGWKGDDTVELFRYGFEFVNQSTAILDRKTHWDVKRFYDRLCEMLTK